MLFEAMAEKTLYVVEAVTEDGPAEVEVCAIGVRKRSGLKDNS